jgi:hypothetical protein
MSLQRWGRKNWFGCSNHSKSYTKTCAFHPPIRFNLEPYSSFGFSMRRRSFLKYFPALGFLFPPVLAAAETNTVSSPAEPGKKTDRDYWVQLLDKIASPVLSNMSQGLLQKNMEVRVSPTWDKRPVDVAYMEALGRLLAGIAPFLALPEDLTTTEGRIRKRLLVQAQQSLQHAVNPESPDYLNWGSPTNRQPLVDAAFLAQALLSAPEVLWKPLDAITKDRLIAEFKKMRQIEPYKSNWLLFAAMIETFLLSIGETIDAARIDNAIDTIQTWYVGDGWYSDGPRFHFDHYNGYVIHPLLTEILRVNMANGRRSKQEFDTAYKRMQRYGYQQERFITPEGYYPVFGRSSTYRAGLFQPLAKLALDQSLPAGISPAQVRCGLTAMLKHVFIPSSFTARGYLTLGLVGNNQEAIADSYTNTGSLYITSYVLLPLGLPSSDPFWSAPFEEWTQRKAWSGKPFAKDYAVDY